MNCPDVVLIGYQDQGNLGMGYLASVLQQDGRDIELIDVRDGPEAICQRLQSRQPSVVGFSLIFQFFLPQFRSVATRLRQGGVMSHFTIGGHYASLCYEEVFRNFPELDSVVRFEGELTIVDLLRRLESGDDWHLTPGIAYEHEGSVLLSEPRALVHDLDELPLPYRPYEPMDVCGFRTMPLLSSRGCARRCSFCSIHTFYRTAPGRTVRVRSPEKVIDEMLYLNRDRGVRVFLFQDDDFPLWGRRGRRWAEELVERLHQSGLANQALWKISCRAEYVEPALFSALRDAGLFLVYMGIESGVEEGLEVLHKQLTVEQNLTGVGTLKDLGLLFSYGFMLLDPSSTFGSVRENLGFLRQIVGDGSAAATFCRMLPYGGTPIRDQLEAEGRLRGDVTHPDYDFLDTRLNDYYRWLHQAAAPWISDDGLSHEFNWALEELEIVARLLPDAQGVEDYRRSLRAIVATSNHALFQLVEESSVLFESEQLASFDRRERLGAMKLLREEMLEARNAFVADNLSGLMESTDVEAIRGPVLAPYVH
jgi:radical SAM superfamily enzyme YgiQ (UPF0313 family)